VKDGNLDTACKVLDAMTEQGITPDIYTFINYINLLCKADRFDDAYQVSSSVCFLLLDIWVSTLGSKVEI
jgi:pentatricopeptide repeat protein